MFDYVFEKCISKKFPKGAKSLKKGKKRWRELLDFQKNAYLCSPFWTMEIDFLTLKGQF
jgi:hypothetical protein